MVFDVAPALRASAVCFPGAAGLQDLRPNTFIWSEENQSPSNWKQADCKNHWINRKKHWNQNFLILILVSNIDLYEKQWC